MLTNWSSNLPIDKSFRVSDILIIVRLNTDIVLVQYVSFKILLASIRISDVVNEHEIFVDDNF